MKVLILSTGTGEGHNFAGKAVREQFVKRGIPCVMKDALTFASDKASYYGKKIYIWSTVKATGVFSGAYKAGRAISSSRHKSPVYYANSLYAGRLYHYILENDFDTIIMPHLFPAEAVTYMMRKYAPSIKSYFIATDYTCIPFTEETEMDYYFLPHKDLKQEFQDRGIPVEKLVVTGIPVSERFCHMPEKEEARRRLGIDPSQTCILVMTGSMGFGPVEKLVGYLAEKIQEDAKVFVMGGTNEDLKASLRKGFQGDHRIMVLDFIEEPQVYLSAADLLFTKPGGLTSTEAAVVGIPLAHTTPIPGCEQRNVIFFSERGMSVTDQKEEKLVNAGLELLQDKGKAASMISRQQCNSNSRAAEDIFNFIIAHAGLKAEEPE